MRRLAESSPVIVTALNRYIGYEAAAAVAHEALASGTWSSPAGTCSEARLLLRRLMQFSMYSR
jgi:fumarate hydratase class II